MKWCEVFNPVVLIGIGLILFMVTMYILTMVVIK